MNIYMFLLVGRDVPTKAIHVRNKKKPRFENYCRCAFGLMQEAHFQWIRDHSRANWEEFVHCQVMANETYLEV